MNKGQEHRLLSEPAGAQGHAASAVQAGSGRFGRFMRRMLTAYVRQFELGRPPMN